jgi:cytoskeletal protein RodZ
MVAGAVAVVVGLLGLVTTRGANVSDANAAASTTTSAASASATGSGPAASTTDPTATPPVTTSSTPSTSTPTDETVEEFLALYLEASSTGDTAFLVARLNQSTLDRYGADQCTAYLDANAGTVGALTLRRVVGTSDWDYVTDGRTETVPDATAIEVQRVVDGRTGTQEIHWKLVDHRYTWFSDCGDPIG